MNGHGIIARLVGPVVEKVEQVLRVVVDTPRGVSSLGGRGAPRGGGA